VGPLRLHGAENVEVHRPDRAWLLYSWAYPTLPPHTALLIAAAVAVPLSIIFRSTLVEFSCIGAADPASVLSDPRVKDTLRSQLSRIALRLVGTVVIVCAAMGLLYTGSGLQVVASGALEEVPDVDSYPYLYHFYFLFLAICIGCYITLIICGLRFVRLLWSPQWPFVGVMAIEWGIHFFTGMLWSHAQYGPSAAAATGIAQGGMTFQFAIFLPLWAPLVAWIAGRSLGKDT
jgi:hypothetical protein